MVSKVKSRSTRVAQKNVKQQHGCQALGAFGARDLVPALPTDDVDSHVALAEEMTLFVHVQVRRIFLVQLGVCPFHEAGLEICHGALN